MKYSSNAWSLQSCSLLKTQQWTSVTLTSITGCIASLRLWSWPTLLVKSVQSQSSSGVLTPPSPHPLLPGRAGAGRDPGPTFVPHFTTPAPTRPPCPSSLCLSRLALLLLRTFPAFSWFWLQYVPLSDFLCLLSTDVTRGSF